MRGHKNLYLLINNPTKDLMSKGNFDAQNLTINEGSSEGCANCTTKKSISFCHKEILELLASIKEQRGLIANNQHHIDELLIRAKEKDETIKALIEVIKFELSRIPKV